MNGTNGRKLVMVGLVVATACGVTSADIVPDSLRLSRVGTTVRLDWDAGMPPYAIYRAPTPQSVIDPPNMVAQTSSTTYEEPIDATSQRFFRVADPPPVQPVCTLDALPLVVSQGDTSTLSWTTTDTVSTTLNGQTVGLNGSLDVRPVTDRIYTLEATGNPGTTAAVCQATVTVSPGPGCSATAPCVAWCGDGTIDDVLTGQDHEIDGDDMVHVLILPEGYTAADLATGVFDDDVDEWIAQWEILDPYSVFKDAFCIWKQPVPSNERIASAAPQTADTAFLVPITSSGNGIDGDIPLTGPTSQRVWATVDSEFPFPPDSFYPSGGRTSKIAHNLVIVMLVLDPDDGESGLSGRARRLENPLDSNQRLSAAFAHNRPHEFSHAFSRVNDEYMEDCCGPLCQSVGPNPPSADLTNVVCDPGCSDLPWAHLLPGTSINPGTLDLVGSFGVSIVGFHPELKCLMNGTHDNSIYYGGDGNLRVHDRFCNFCREIGVFRLFERIRVLSDPAVSWSAWGTSYRSTYFTRFGFDVPSPVPQENSAGTPVFDGCTTVESAPAHAAGSGGCDAVDPD